MTKENKSKEYIYLIAIIAIIAIVGILTVNNINLENIGGKAYTKEEYSYYTEKDISLIEKFADAVEKEEYIKIELSDGLKIEFYLTSTLEHFVEFSEEIEPIEVNEFINNNARESDPLFNKIDKFFKSPQIKNLPFYNVEINTKKTELKQTILDNVQGIIPTRGCSCGNSLTICLWASQNLCATGSGGGNIWCFLEDTEIDLNEKSEKIQNIIIGDIVKSYDTENNEIVYSEVTNIFKGKTKEYFLINNNWQVTQNHPFWIDEKWKKASNIEVGDFLMSSNKQDIRVESIIKIHENADIYNIEVNNYHNYFANNALVHNKAFVGGYITSVSIKISFTF